MIQFNVFRQIFDKILHAGTSEDDHPLLNYIFVEGFKTENSQHHHADHVHSLVENITSYFWSTFRLGLEAQDPLAPRPFSRQKYDFFQYFLAQLGKTWLSYNKKNYAHI